LLALRRVVVLFDECEELFRRRNVVYSPEHRTQSDFITSGMLPRLQARRDKRWIVFVMATNTEFDELDPAVVRFGRLDGRQRIGHPDVAAQTEYLFKGLKMTNTQREIVRQVLQKYDKRLASESRPMSRDALTKARKKLLEPAPQRVTSRKYFKKMSRLRAREAELPVVTFWVLDQFRRILESRARASGTTTSAGYLAALQELCELRGRPPEWTDKYGSTVVKKTGSPGGSTGSDRDPMTQPGTSVSAARRSASAAKRRRGSP
jgi:Spy/CpxP family protein refolding chaperone